MPINTEFVGAAPDIGTYETGTDHYWIPGRQESHASMPVPRDGGANVPTNADLIYLIGLGGRKASIYLGTSPKSLIHVATKAPHQNIVTPLGEHSLQPNTTYQWHVDTELPDDALMIGPTRSFTTAAP